MGQLELAEHSLGSSRPSRKRFDGPAMVKHFRWQLGTDFSIIINLAQQLRGIMVLAAPCWPFCCLLPDMPFLFASASYQPQ